MTHIDKKIGYHSGEVIQNNVINYLELHAQEFPDRIALKWVDRTAGPIPEKDPDSPFVYKQINFGEFSKLVGIAAKNLQLIGIKKNERVIIFLPMSLELYTAMFAIQRIGAIAVFLDSWARRDQLGASAECVDPAAMISHHAAFELIKNIPEFASMRHRIIAGPGSDPLYTATLQELMTKNNGESEIEPVTSEFTALITFTTGSSGKPKGANRTHRFLSAQHKELHDVIPYTASDKDLPAFPIFSLNNIASGVTTILPALNLANPTGLDSAMLVNQIVNEKLTCCTLSPSMLNNLSEHCRANKIQLPGLRRVVTGGAPISKDDVKNFSAIAPNSKVWVLYGSTEVEPMAHIEAQEMIHMEVNTDPEIVEEGVNVGHISENLNYKFIRVHKGIIEGENSDLSEWEVPPGEVGEFIVSGDHVCQNYYNNEQAFKGSKIRDKDGTIWHRTGDLAYIDSKKYLWMVGRIHNVIQRANKYYFPVRPEVLLKRFDFVDKCAFLGIPDSQLGEKNAIVIQPSDNFSREKHIGEIVRIFRKNLVPVDAFYLVKSIPFDPRHHSKVEYEKLRSSLTDSEAVDLSSFEAITH